MATAWSEITDIEEPLDEGVKSLLELCPPEMRATAEPMMRGFLSTIKAALGQSAYDVFVSDVVRAVSDYREGNTETARAVLAQYGIPVEALQGYLPPGMAQTLDA